MVLGAVNSLLWGANVSSTEQSQPVQQSTIPLTESPIRRDRPSETQQVHETDLPPFEVREGSSVSQVAYQGSRHPSVIGYPPTVYQMPSQPSVVGYPQTAYQMPQQQFGMGYPPAAYQMPQQQFGMGYPLAAYQMPQQPGYPLPYQVSEQPSGIGPSIGRNLKGYWAHPVEKITRESSLKCLAYSLAIKISGLFLALIFPFIGYMIFGMSITLIDRVIILNFRNFIDKLPLFGYLLNTLFPQPPQNINPGTRV